MDIAKAIQIIESLYPPDSQYDDTAEIGCNFMVIAILNAGSWRELPEPVLQKMAELCIYAEKSLSNKPAGH